MQPVRVITPLRARLLEHELRYTYEHPDQPEHHDNRFTLFLNGRSNVEPE